MAHVVSACSGTRCDIHQTPARLVDGDRERRSGKRAATRVALGRCLRECSRNHGIERWRQFGALDARSRRLRLEVCEDHRELGVAPERWLSNKALVKDAAERVDVRPPVDLFSRDLLRSDVVDRAEELAVAAKYGLLGDPPGEPEVREVDVVGAIGTGADVEQHVGGLHVAMDETARVSRIQGARQLREDADRIGRVEAAASETPFRSRPST